MAATFEIVRVSFVMCAVACLSVTACGKPASPVQPSGVESPSTAAGADGEQEAALAAVRRATAAFHDVDQAIAAGYGNPTGGVCEQSAAGAMGVHSANATLVRNPAIVIETPEVLLYLPTPEGGYRLVGVEYFQTVMVRNRTTNVVAPWRGSVRWDDPQYGGLYELVNQAPALFGRTFDGPMAGHTPTMPWHYELHVWAWAPNPSGVFASWNPSLSCQ